MTLLQYLVHLWWWLRSFPRWSPSEHTTTGIAGGGEYHCLVCGCQETWEDDDSVGPLKREMLGPVIVLAGYLLCGAAMLLAAFLALRWFFGWAR